jgi:acyl CoA:acetate/3-ketoacid CoA transferase
MKITSKEKLLTLLLQFGNYVAEKKHEDIEDVNIQIEEIATIQKAIDLVEEYLFEGV